MWSPRPDWTVSSLPRTAWVWSKDAWRIRTEPMSSWPRRSVNACMDGTSAASSRWVRLHASPDRYEGIRDDGGPPRARSSTSTSWERLSLTTGSSKTRQINSPTYYVLTPAAAKGDTSGFQYVEYNFALSSSANQTAVLHDIERVLPKGQTFDFDHLSAIEGEVNRSVRPVALALGVFGALGPSRRAPGGSSDDRSASLSPAIRPRDHASSRRESSGASFRRDPGSHSRHLGGNDPRPPDRHGSVVTHVARPRASPAPRGDELQRVDLVGCGRGPVCDPRGGECRTGDSTRARTQQPEYPRAGLA